MQLPMFKPHSNAFMVFSMLLLGVFAASLVAIFDFFFVPSGNNNSLSTFLFTKVRGAEIPLILVASILSLILTSLGFFFYLCSFFLLSVPTLFVSKIFQHTSADGGKLFMAMANEALLRVIPSTISTDELSSRRFKHSFMYLLLTSEESANAANLRFLFAQLMFARSIGGIFIFFAFYICKVLSVSVVETFFIVLITNIIFCILYLIGISFYESVLTCGSLIKKDRELTLCENFALKSNSNVSSIDGANS